MTSNYNNTTNENTAKNAAFVALCEYVDGLGCLSQPLADLVELSDFDNIADTGDLENKITYSCNPFEEDIIYYSAAMEYLTENDRSLQYSLGLAADYGFTPDKINSCLLASLLMEDNNRETWNDHRDNIDSLIEDINDADDENDNETEND